jgi:hypothetical protein
MGPTRATTAVLAAALLAGLASVALGGDAAPEKPAASKPGAKSSPEILWARTWSEATEEATERNVAIYLHSHGST